MADKETKECTNSACATMGIKIDTANDKCIACGKKLKKVTTWEETINQIFHGRDLFKRG